MDLFGFSKRLGISIPKVNMAVSLLVEIGYIEKSDSTLKVLKWNSKQSEYCRKITKTPESVRTVSGECPPRGEEIRREERGKNGSPPSSQLVEWSKEYGRVLDGIKRLNSTYSDHQTWSEQDREAKRKLIARRDELKSKLDIQY